MCDPALSVSVMVIVAVIVVAVVVVVVVVAVGRLGASKPVVYAAAARREFRW